MNTETATPENEAQPQASRLGWSEWLSESGGQILSGSEANFMNNNDEVLKPEQYGDSAHIDIWYPRVPNEPDDEKPRITNIVVGLMDVRAADDIRVSYDFERDGWKIEQASTFEWDADDEVCDEDWQEVAFIQAWGREKRTGAEAPAPDSDNHRI